MKRLKKILSIYKAHAKCTLQPNTFCATGDATKVMADHRAICAGVKQAKATLLGEGSATRREVKHVRWERPPEGWWKMNVDGVASKGTRKGGTGGVLRDCWDRRESRFVMSVSFADNISVELWGMFKGLALVWASGQKKIILETDSKAGIELVRVVGRESSYHNMVCQIRNYVNRDWECHL